MQTHTHTQTHTYMHMHTRSHTRIQNAQTHTHTDTHIRTHVSFSFDTRKLTFIQFSSTWRAVILLRTSNKRFKTKKAFPRMCVCVCVCSLCVVFVVCFGLFLCLVFVATLCDLCMLFAFVWFVVHVVVLVAHTHCAVISRGSFATANR